MKIKTTVVKKTEYLIEENWDDGTRHHGHKKRTAVIYVEDTFFEKCEFSISNHSSYTADDWKFLNIVSNQIIAIGCKENNE